MTNHRYITDVDRRTILRYAGASTAIGLAGCVGGDDDEEDDEETPAQDDDDDEETPAEDEDEDDDEQQEVGDETLFFAQVKGPLDLDPIVSNDVPSFQIIDQLMDGLYEYDLGLDLQPKIAADMPEVEEDGTRYIVPLREEAEFWNGDPVTAEDVIHTHVAPFEEDTANAAEVDMIESAEAVDEHTVQFDLEFPYGAFTTTMARNIVNAEVRQDDPDGYNVEPVGSGPFQLVDWEEEDFATIERWDDYWDQDEAGLPNVQSVEFDPIEEQTTRVTSLQTGDNDIIETIPPQLYETVEEMDEATIEEEMGIGYFYLAFNCNEGPTTDPTVREAIDYCFSMDQAIENFVTPSGDRQYSPLPTAMAEQWDMPLDEWQEIPHDRDLDQAQQLFEEAGVDADYDWRIIVPPDDMREQIGVSIGDGLQAAGFDNVEVQRLDWGTFGEQYPTGNESDYNMYTLGWAGSPDPDSFVYHLLAQETDGVTNGTFHDYDEASDQIVQARETPDQEERRELYVEAITQLLEERVHLPAYNLKNSYGVADYVDDFHAHPTSTIQIFTDHNNVSVNR